MGDQEGAGDRHIARRNADREEEEESNKKE